MEKNEVKENWAKRGFGCELWTDPPGKVWKDYVHDTDELVKTYRPKPGEELLIPAGQKHTVTNIGSMRNRWWYGYKKG